jgi:hypothetical protein
MRSVCARVLLLGVITACSAAPESGELNGYGGAGGSAGSSGSSGASASGGSAGRAAGGSGIGGSGSGSSGGGWQYTADRTKIILCGDVCSEVKADTGARIDIVLGCKTVAIPA